MFLTSTPTSPPSVAGHSQVRIVHIGIISNSMSRIIIVLLALALVSCSETLDIQLEPELTVFLSTDSDARIRLTEADKEHAALNEWLHEHRSGWHPTSGRYPGGVYMKSGNYGIQVTDTHVVLYSSTSPEPRAIYIQKLGHNELSSVISLGKQTNNLQ